MTNDVHVLNTDGMVLTFNLNLYCIGKGARDESQLEDNLLSDNENGSYIISNVIFTALQYIEPKEADADDEDANELLEDDDDDIESPSDDDGTVHVHVY